MFKWVVFRGCFDGSSIPLLDSVEVFPGPETPETPDWLEVLLGPKRTIATPELPEIPEQAEPLMSVESLMEEIRNAIQPGNFIGGKYAADFKLGEGNFGVVAFCRALTPSPHGRAAVKLVVRGPHTVRELRALARLRAGAAELSEHRGRLRVVRYFGDFAHNGKIHCMEFEPLGISLKNLIRSNKAGMYIEDIQAIAIDCLAALDYCHSLNIVHTDVKPENILLVATAQNSLLPARWGRLDDERSPEMRYRRPGRSEGVMAKLIDFSSADQPGKHLITTLPYRSPEALLLGHSSQFDTWDFSTDMWSLGCTLAELCTGNFLVANMQENLHDNLFKITRILSGGLEERLAPHSAQLLSFVKDCCIRMQPDDRATAREALRHPFFTLKDLDN
jgi:serine/threonine protein kinase